MKYLVVVVASFAVFAFGATPPGRYIVQLNGEPASSYSGTEARHARTNALLSEHARLRESIRQQGAEVTGETTTVLNTLFVRVPPGSGAELESLPGVSRVYPVRLRRLMLDHALPLEKVLDAWNQIGGMQNAGAGIKIGIIDTGIDQTHPAFQDPSLTPPSGYPICDVPPPDCIQNVPSNCAYTNNKIIVARSYVCEIVYSDVSGSDLAAQSRPDDLTARDLDGHGTAVASVAAGMPVSYGVNTTTGAAVNISGVAPKAFLGNYKVFGSDEVNPNGSGNILQALDDAVTDGMNVVNMSLGSPAAYYGPLDTDPTFTYCGGYPLPTGTIPMVDDACDPLAYEVESAMENALVTVVVAAGNQGADGYQFNYGNSSPTFSTMSSPAYAPSAIAVGGVQNDLTYVQRVEISGTGVPPDVQAIEAYESYDGPPPLAKVTGTLVDTTSTGSLCTPAPASLSGDIALVQQGSCADVTMVTNAQNAQAAGVIEIADAAGFYFPSGLSGTTIPTFIIAQSDGANLQSYIDANPGASATMDPTPYQVSAESQGLAPYSVAYFSSRGPVNESGWLKPDLVAAATDFLIPTETYDPYGELFNFSGYGTTQGTSFATPMVTGSAALVMQANPSLPPLQIKSALVNTAALSNLTTSDASAQASVTEVGAGLLQTQNAIVSTVQVVPSSVSFGALGSQYFQSSVPLALYNTGASQVTLTMTVVPIVSSPGTNVLVNGSSSASVAIPANGTANVTASLSASPTVAGRFEGVITATGGPVPLAIPYMFVAGDGVPYDVIPLNATEPGQGFSAFDGGVGAQIPWYQACTNTNNNCINDYGPIAVQVIDQYGVPISGVPVTWAATQGGGTIVQGSNYTDSATNANGVAGATVNMGSSAGPQEFTVNVVGMVLPFDGYARVPAVIGGIVDGASFTVGRAVAPGSLISVFGTNLSDSTQGNNGVDNAFDHCSLCSVVNQALPMGIDGAAVSFDTASASLPGRMLYVSFLLQNQTYGQLNVQVPWELAGQTSVTVKSIVNYTYSPEYTLPLAEYSPGFFAGSDKEVAALDTSYNPVNSGNPVARGAYVQLFMNGLGPVNCPAGPPACATANQPADGVGAPSGPISNLATTVTNPTITIGGQPATYGQYGFSGLAPGFVGLYQVNVQVPTGISAGAQTITCSIGTVSCASANIYVK